MHLGRDSNDWYARTYLTVKPKNILSDVSEETLDLYENRFVKTLIDKILICVRERRIKLENLINRDQNNFISDSIQSRNEYIHIKANSDRLLKIIIKNNADGSQGSFCSDLKKDYEEIRSLERKIINLRYSAFYSALRKCRKTGNPINKTNILMYDANYNRCYKLWEYLNDYNEEEDKSYDEYELKQYEDYYYAYVVFNVIASLHNSGYEELNNPCFNYNDDKLTVSQDMLWVLRDTQLKVVLDPLNNRIIFSLLIDEVLNKWDNFEIYTNYINFEGKSRIQIEDITTQIISELAKRDKKYKVSGKYCFVSMDINECSEGNNFGEKLYRRFFNIGDNYTHDEVNLKDIADYKTGIQIITPLDLRYNFLHIQRIINAHILRNKSSVMDGLCPLCGSEKTAKQHDYMDCYDCGHRISFTKCSSCGEQRLLWIKYLDDSALKKKEITETVSDKPYYFQLMKFETIMGEYAISSFRLEEEVTGWKLKSICPKCGKVLGETNSSETIDKRKKQ